MSNYKEMTLMYSIIYDNCIIIAPGSTITEFFVNFNNWPIFLGYVFIGLTIVHWDYFFLLLTVTDTVDSAINQLLQNSFDTPPGYQPPQCPINPLQNPALASEKIVVLYTVFWCLVAITYPKTKITTSNIVFINMSAVTAMYSRFYLGFSTPVEMFTGAAIGLIEGCFLATVFHLVYILDIDRYIITSLQKLHLNITDDFLGIHRIELREEERRQI